MPIARCSPNGYRVVPKCQHHREGAKSKLKSEFDRRFGQKNRKLNLIISALLKKAV